MVSKMFFSWFLRIRYSERVSPNWQIATLWCKETTHKMWIHLRHCGSLTIRMPAGAVGHGGGKVVSQVQGARYKQVAIRRQKYGVTSVISSYIQTWGDCFILNDIL